MATSGEASSGSSGGGGSGISVSELATSLSSRPAQLVRARSGPATLSHAVFEMLYVELRSVIGGIRRARTVKARERARAKAMKAKRVREDAAAAAAEDAAQSSAKHDGDEGSKTEVPTEAVGADGVPDIAAAAASKHGGEDSRGAGCATSTVATDTTGARGGNEAVQNTKEDDAEEKEERAVFERLADMRDDLGCLTLSRELQVDGESFIRVRLWSKIRRYLECLNRNILADTVIAPAHWIHLSSTPVPYTGVGIGVHHALAVRLLNGILP